MKITSEDFSDYTHTHTHTHTQELAKVDLLKINEEEINKDTNMISMVKKKNYLIKKNSERTLGKMVKPSLKGKISVITLQKSHTHTHTHTYIYTLSEDFNIATLQFY